MTAHGTRKPDDQRALPVLGAPTFSLNHRMSRLLWIICWLIGARWTPPGWMPLRRALLTAFGAKIHPTARVRSSVRIWWPGHLEMAPHSSLGPKVNCYNVAPVTLHGRANISQGAHLCTAGHDIDRPDFPMRASAITVGADAWIAAEAFVGPGVHIGEGAVLGARGVAMRSLDPWVVYAGNPAKALRNRQPFNFETFSSSR
ncbi:putative colanic acid biosynthesis acetyltransferase [Qingshengfaniella alkalisoli]|uniref:Putative colanic acid biosynthesis acetyltransferase n=1 Tax=Qingshengfaniella alkalisoli TaxID=2599296 RepID=A0A5B8IZV3_9RHOB|nr:putative colanic acid biosynthesis acetyltransferase [Qingshengfaniella alkalisoli]QDY70481.1 putative colanic acid biosynthesis acetyltransferase [Qingshengfaniella alkalisoli]